MLLLCAAWGCAAPAVTGAPDDGGTGGETVTPIGTGGASGTVDAGPAMPDVDASAIEIADASAVTDEAKPPPRDFVCSELIGLWVASQWWGSFEQGVDSARWQFMFQHHGYLELFADPASPFWKNAIASPCAAQSTTPDRVIFLPFSLTLKTQDEWRVQLSKVVETIKGKFAGIRRIELLTTLRSPDNMLCPNDRDPGTIVAPEVDQAIQAVADASAGLVTVGPRIALSDCAWWAGGTDLTGPGNTGVGQLMSAYYREHP
jgi:hypothetical protein